LSFGEDQARVNRKSPPPVIIGSAGSGKAALALQKVKDARGDILCATRSPFRVQSARDLYYAIGLSAIVMC
jgi:hypothetical protein